MNKIDWKSKLTSRKFWAALIGFITAIMIVFNVDNLTIEQVTGVVSACSVLIAYIIGEGLVDSSRASSTSSTSSTDTSEQSSTNVIGFSAPSTDESEGDE
ncbi:MAG: hypothetical protein PHR06_01295 [Candidatus Cloacimonetes bacterium]|nr:hypothetical protein [Candidatus Cloacimonadota bacterium]